MIFASKTPEQIDPCRAAGDHQAGQDHRWQECPTAHDAPSLDQQNAPNPILTRFRGRLLYQTTVQNPVTPVRLASVWLTNLPRYAGDPYTPNQYRHAVRVLTRLISIATS